MTWPTTDDGDVFRNLESRDFDFSKPTKIDFEVDFDSWPPSPSAIDVLKLHFPNVEFIDPSDKFHGYAHIEVHNIVEYNFVIETQEFITSLVKEYGAKCEAWGVLHG